MASIKDYATAIVNNKSMGDKIGHAVVFHEIRSAFKSTGSLGSKAGSLGGLVVRLSCKFIPIPIVSSVISELEKIAEKRLRTYIHAEKKNNNKKTMDTPGVELDVAALAKSEYVKFEIKDLSLEVMDRYRFKINDASTELVKRLADLENANKNNESNVCAHYMNAALATAQLRRRQKKLVDFCNTITSAIHITEEWMAGFDVSINDAEASLETNYKKYQSDSESSHGSTKLNEMLRAKLSADKNVTDGKSNHEEFIKNIRNSINLKTQELNTLQNLPKFNYVNSDEYKLFLVDLNKLNENIKAEKSKLDTENNTKITVSYGKTQKDANIKSINYNINVHKKDKTVLEGRKASIVNAKYYESDDIYKNCTSNLSKLRSDLNHKTSNWSRVERDLETKKTEETKNYNDHLKVHNECGDICCLKLKSAATKGMISGNIQKLYDITNASLQFAIGQATSAVPVAGYSDLKIGKVVSIDNFDYGKKEE